MTPHPIFTIGQPVRLVSDGPYSDWKEHFGDVGRITSTDAARDDGLHYRVDWPNGDYSRADACNLAPAHIIP